MLFPSYLTSQMCLFFSFSFLEGNHNNVYMGVLVSAVLVEAWHIYSAALYYIMYVTGITHMKE